MMDHPSRAGREPAWRDQLDFYRAEEPVLYDELLGWLAAKLGLPPPPRSPSPRVGLFGGHKRCDSRRLRDSGYRFIYPTFRAGYGSLLASSS